MDDFIVNIVDSITETCVTNTAPSFVLCFGGKHIIIRQIWLDLIFGVLILASSGPSLGSLIVIKTMIFLTNCMLTAQN